MCHPYQVVDYSFEKLLQLFVENSRARRQIVNAKRHCKYLHGYLNDIGTKAIVVESEYVDHGFLEDFAGYYVRCFKNYERKCSRLHFFNTALKVEYLDAILGGSYSRETEEALNKSYLGFVVVKPLPETIIGRTCLRTYPEVGGQRNFPTKRPYKANLFGIPLTLDTLAFQEQDEVAAACATSALWSAFQGTGKLFHHRIPAPIEITIAAGEHSSFSRTLPNEGLTGPQMAQAIRSVGLEPFPVNAEKTHVLRSTLYAYLRGGIPVLLLIRLVGSEFPHDSRHAVTVTGYSLDMTNSLPPREPIGLHLKASRIDKIYAHDDQVGPFARIEVGDNGYLATSCPESSGPSRYFQSVPENLLVPLYHKIRIPFEVLLGRAIFPFDSVFELYREKGDIRMSKSVEWDIYLATVSEFKQEILTATRLDTDCRRSVLAESMPRYLWRASAFRGEELALDLLFDATDIEQGRFFIRAIEYDPELSRDLRRVSREPGLAAEYDVVSQIFEWFSKRALSEGEAA